MIVALVTAAVVIGYLVGRSYAQTSPRLRAIEMLLGERDKPMLVPEELNRLKDDLVRAGWVHEDHVADPIHHDEAGRYLYWGD